MQLLSCFIWHQRRQHEADRQLSARTARPGRARPADPAVSSAATAQRGCGSVAVAEPGCQQHMLARSWALPAHCGGPRSLGGALRPWQRPSNNFLSLRQPVVACQTSQRGLGSGKLQFPELTLERTTGQKEGRDGPLWEAGAFTSGIYPDLPAGSIWAALWHR